MCSSDLLDLSDVQLGDSIAVSGPCLTVVSFDAHSFEVDVSSETLACTTTGRLQVGDNVNLEKALRLDERLGGHLVSGHVDGIGTLTAKTALDDYLTLSIEVPAELARSLAFKGSVCLDGVSLTVNAVSATGFEVLTIPHTLERTTLGQRADGDPLNIEVDLIARYIERLLTSGADAQQAGLSLATLAAAGVTANNA